MPVASETLVDDGTVKEPINRESSMEELISSGFITTNGNYDRNHGPLLHLKAADHVIEVEGLVPRPLKVTMAALTNDFPQHKVTCALQCAGNRRHSMRTRVKQVQGVDWGDAAIMNAQWEGPKLRDVLVRAGAEILQGQEGGLHVQFGCRGQKTQEDEFYGGSIPFEKAMREDQDVILAMRMNGEPLPVRHGFPVRVIVPGVLGARSVKWLDQIVVSDQESPCFYQRHDYKVLPPEAVDAESAEKYWEKVPAMLDMPVNACVALPCSESVVPLNSSGLIEVRGYAVPQGNQGPVVRVQVSGDEGNTWTDAKIDDGGKNASTWSWVLWTAQLKMSIGKGRKIYAKATDAGNNVQDEMRSTWNLRGVVSFLKGFLPNRHVFLPVVAAAANLLPMP